MSVSLLRLRAFEKAFVGLRCHRIATRAIRAPAQRKRSLLRAISTRASARLDITAVSHLERRRRECAARLSLVCRILTDRFRRPRSLAYPAAAEELFNGAPVNRDFNGSPCVADASSCRTGNDDPFDRARSKFLSNLSSRLYEDLNTNRTRYSLVFFLP